jgi:hypothetical protein
MASPAGWRTLPRRPLAVLRSFPFTLGAIGVILLTGVATGTLWNGLRDRPLLDQVGYGLPALEHRRWWTPMSGSVFALRPVGLYRRARGVGVLVGFAEWRLGSRTAAAVIVATQLVVVTVTSAVLIPLRATEWECATRVAGGELAGFLPGGFGAVAASTVTLRAPWRVRMRVVLIGYVILLLLYRGAPRDLQNVLAVGLGLLLGPVVVAGRPPRIGRRPR